MSGPVIAADISVADLNGATIANIQSDNQADFSLTLPASTNFPVVLTATGGTDMVTGTAPDFMMYSVAFDTNTDANINVFSTIIVKTARNMINGLTPTNVQLATQIIIKQLNFGLDLSLVADPIHTPVSPQNIATFVKANQALAETVRRTVRTLNATGSPVSEDEYLDILSADISDGILDGIGAASSNPRYAAVTNVVAAQVLIEILDNNLTINGVSGTSLIDNAVRIASPANTMAVTDTAVNQELLTQTKTAIKATLAVYGVSTEGDTLSPLRISNSSPNRYVWDTLDAGKRMFTDRTYIYKSWQIPAVYVGMKQLRTAKNDRASTGNAFVSFQTSLPVTVYVAHHNLIVQKPAWLASWTNTGDTIVNRTIFKKDFPANSPISLGGNTVDGAASGSMYMVFLEPAINPESFPILDLLSQINQQSPATTASGFNFVLPAGADASVGNVLSSLGYAFDTTLQDINNTLRENNGIIRINTGGGAYVDHAGNFWAADKGYNTGNSYAVQDPISGTVDDVLYRSERWDPVSGPELAYQFAVPNGNYIVNLHFMDRFPAAGKRVFDVNIEGQSVLTDFDTVKEVGNYTALVKSFPVRVTDNQINIDFIHKIQNPNIGAIEILRQPPSNTAASANRTQSVAQANISAAPDMSPSTVVSGTTPAPATTAVTQSAPVNSTAPVTQQPIAAAASPSSNTALNGTRDTTSAITVNTNSTGGSLADPTAQQIAIINASTTASVNGIIRINTGGGAYVDHAGNFWAADKGYNTGNSYAVQDPISGTVDDVLYRSERWDPVSGPELAYQFAVPNGNYIVNLHFMDRFPTAGKRVFDVNIEGQSVLTDFDTVKEVGNYTALVKSFPATVTDNQINIDFIHKIQNPNIGAIEILRQPPSNTAASANRTQSVAQANISAVPGITPNTITSGTSTGTTPAAATNSAGRGISNGPGNVTGSNSITLTWAPSTDVVTGYVVHFGTTAAFATTPVLDLPITTSGFDPLSPSATFDIHNDLGLQTGGTACFRLKAYNTTGSSAPSAAVCSVVP